MNKGHKLLNWKSNKVRTRHMKLKKLVKNIYIKKKEKKN